MRTLLGIILAIIFATSVVAQEDDRSFLTGLLEDVLSDAGREVRIEGFKGALSAQATIERLTIADDTGIWLTLEKVQLDWRRLALLKGRLEVEQLSAARLEMPRAPVRDASGLPSPEAGGFSLPDLPVSVDVQTFKVDRIDLGEPLLGEPVSLALEASAKLEAGSGAVALEATRLDEKTGRFIIDGAFDRESRNLDVTLDLFEEADGIVARLLDIPQRPPVRLLVSGSGPLNAFSADINLSTDEVPRLSGTIILSEAAAGEETQDKPIGFDVDLGGDIAGLFAPEYRPFFGDNVRLAATGRRHPDGVIRLSALDLETRALSLTGRVHLNADGWPELLDIKGRIADETGAPVVLPVSGAVTRVDGMDLEVAYDRTAGDRWRGDFRIEGFRRDDFQAGMLLLGGGGLLRGEVGAIGLVTADLDFSARGLGFSDPGLTDAVGESVSGSVSAEYVEGEPLSLPFITVRGAQYGLTGSALIRELAAGLETEFDLTLNAARLEGFSTLAGRPLGGQLEVSARGAVAPLAGTFDLEAEGTSVDLSLGDAQLDPLLRPETQLSVRAARSEAGTRLDALRLRNSELSLEARADLSATTGSVAFEAGLRDLGRIVPQLTGPLEMSGNLDKGPEGWAVVSQAAGPGGMAVQIGGLIRDTDDVDLTVEGSARLALLGPFIEPRSAQGTVAFDLAVQGAPALSAISGQITTTDARISAPRLGIAVTDVDAAVAVRDGQANIGATGGLTSGGRISVNGPVGFAQGFPADLAIVLEQAVISDPRLFKALLDGRIAIDGPLSGGAMISGRLDVNEMNVIVPSSAITSYGEIPQIRHIGAPRAVQQTLQRAGLSGRSEPGAEGGPSYGLDISLNAPARIFVRGRGLDAELGGALSLTGTSQDIISAGAFELIRGRIDILSKRFQLDEGSIQLEGRFSPYVRFVATTATDAGSASVIVEGPASAPEVSFSSVPEAPEDEVLAQLFFGRNLTQISAFQALQLANAVATLSGRGNEGLVSRFRTGFGLDDLDVSTDAEGRSAVRAGKYISDNVYTDVTVGGEDDGKVSLNIDLSRSVTARGTLRSDGDTSLGMFFEKDY
ncbi:MAG: translocation/assembly module TamB domain-containing protein [Paracoccaceae bacterium]